MSVHEFWHEHPRRLIMMLDQRQESKIQEMKLLAGLINGTMEIADSKTEKKGKRPGVDCPAGEGSTAWMYG